MFSGTTIYVGYGVELGTAFHCLAGVALTAFVFAVIAPPTLGLSAPESPKALPSPQHSDYRALDKISFVEKPPND